jgi:hypothetical protein
VSNQKTSIRVRIAVGIERSGEWHAVGDSALKDDRAVGWLTLPANIPWSLHWIEADVPLPVSETIEGRVVMEAEQIAEAVAVEGIKS